MLFSKYLEKKKCPSQLQAQAVITARYVKPTIITLNLNLLTSKSTSFFSVQHHVQCSNVIYRFHVAFIYTVNYHQVLQTLILVNIIYTVV